MVWVLYATMLIFALSLYLTGRTAAKINRHVLLNVTLPIEAEQDETVRGIVRDYSRAHTRLFLLALAAAAPLGLLYRTPSYCILYLFSWGGLYLWLFNRVFRRYHDRLYNLKKERGWLTGLRRLLTVDTEVSRLKPGMPLRWQWFLPPLLASCVPIAAALRYPDTALSGAVCAIPLLTVLLFFMLYRMTAGQRTQVYSENTEVNTACTYIYQRAWSVCWVAGAWLHGILLSAFYIGTYLFRWDFWGLLPLLVALTTLGLIVGSYTRIRDRQNRMLAVADAPIYVDEDEYWRTGAYNNPADCRMMVEKRVGYGMTCNLATRGGKLMTYGAMGLTGVVLLFVIGLLLVLDNSRFTMEIVEDTVQIDAPMYGTSIPLADVLGVERIDSLPDGVRTNGAATDRYSLGHYRLDTYGKCLVYVHRGNPPYLVLRLAEQYVILNGETPEQTDAYWTQLLQAGVPAG